MAIDIASGYGNLPNGVFIPEVFSQNVLLGFRRQSIVPDITTTDYFGDIKRQGDTVHILLEPEVSVNALVRGQELVSQDITDSEILLTVDKANYYQFHMDDIEVQQAHVDYSALCASKAAYALNQAYEQEVLAAIYAGVTSGNVEGTTGSPLDIGYDTGTDDYTPYEAINAVERLLDLQDVPNDGNRWLVADPIFFEQLKKEDSKLIESQVMGDGKSVMLSKNGFMGQTISGIRLYKSNNAVTDTAKKVILAGHKNATATASTILDSERIRSERYFRDFFRGKQVYGRKVLRPTSLAALIVQY